MYFIWSPRDILLDLPCAIVNIYTVSPFYDSKEKILKNIINSFTDLVKIIFSELHIMW